MCTTGSIISYQLHVLYMHLIWSLVNFSVYVKVLNRSRYIYGIIYFQNGDRCFQNGDRCFQNGDRCDKKIAKHRIIQWKVITYLVENGIKRPEECLLFFF